MNTNLSSKLSSNTQTTVSYRCILCGDGDVEYVPESNHYSCGKCGEQYNYDNQVLDCLKDLSHATTNELKGMAIESGLKEEEFEKFKVKIKESISGFDEKLKSTEGDHSHYYLQTQLNYKQAFKLLKPKKGERVLEIGSCHDYYFLKPFYDLGCECHGLNIHFNLLENNNSYDWVNKVLADMNRLPFKDQQFDYIVISATSHHSTTPEVLISEISRILKTGGKCLMINDPTWGIVKNLGGPDNTMAFRESHINENEYSVVRYNKAFKKTGLSYQHLFSDFYDQKLLNIEISSQTRFAFVAKILKNFWKISFFRSFFKKNLLWFAQVIFGFPMNVVLTKKQ